MQVAPLRSPGAEVWQPQSRAEDSGCLTLPVPSRWLPAASTGCSWSPVTEVSIQVGINPHHTAFFFPKEITPNAPYDCQVYLLGHHDAGKDCDTAMRSVALGSIILLADTENPRRCP